MKAKVINLDNKAAGDIELSDAIFGVAVRKDILHRMVQYQRAKAQSGTHKTKTVSEISGTGKKPFKQKGTGGARQGSLRSAQMRGGSTIFGPVVRSHAISLTKKFRQLALKTALSAKQAEGTLFIVDSLELKNAKTKDLVAQFKNIGWTKPLIIDGETLNENFAKAARNIIHVDVLPIQGVNVMDILRHKQLVLTRAAIAKLEERFQ